MFMEASRSFAARACIVRAEGKGVILVEGILIFSHPELRDLFDVKIFVDTVSARVCYG